jgi:hypothetical protein
MHKTHVPSHTKPACHPIHQQQTETTMHQGHATCLMRVHGDLGKASWERERGTCMTEETTTTTTTTERHKAKILGAVKVSHTGSESFKHHCVGNNDPTPARYSPQQAFTPPPSLSQPSTLHPHCSIALHCLALPPLPSLFVVASCLADTMSVWTKKVFSSTASYPRTHHIAVPSTSNVWLFGGSDAQDVQYNSMLQFQTGTYYRLVLSL